MAYTVPPPALSLLPALGTVVDGKYELQAFVGQGGMGAVYLAQHVMTGGRCAVKWLLPERALRESNRVRFLREARATGTFRHENVVSVSDVGEHAGGLYLVMEYIEGVPFSRMLAEKGALRPKEALRVILPAMRGVQAAHDRGLVHRDLKPDNIILEQRGDEIVPKVVDFGVAKSFGPTSVEQSTLTETGALIGTPHYMAIEQIDGTGEVDARTDVYAFGVILYQVLTGRLPYQGDTLGSIILQIGTRKPEAPHRLQPSVPASLSAVVMRAMSRDKSARFESLTAMAEALEPFTKKDVVAEPLVPTADQLAGISLTTTSSGELMRERGRISAPWWAIALGLVAVITATAWIARTLP